MALQVVLWDWERAYEHPVHEVTNLMIMEWYIEALEPYHVAIGSGNSEIISDVK